MEQDFTEKRLIKNPIRPETFWLNRQLCFLNCIRANFFIRPCQQQKWGTTHNRNPSIFNSMNCKDKGEFSKFRPNTLRLREQLPQHPKTSNRYNKPMVTNRKRIQVSYPDRSGEDIFKNVKIESKGKHPTPEVRSTRTRRCRYCIQGSPLMVRRQCPSRGRTVKFHGGTITALLTNRWACSMKVWAKGLIYWHNWLMIHNHLCRDFHQSWLISSSVNFKISILDCFY